ncbi:SulP family inorganic anion transporter [Verrucomicrobiales bacterium BCK34]|nr:SulP family inorganic anion transporter [Verrucomicrobiales bacterium BCK34]
MRKFRWLLRRLKHGVGNFVRENQIDFFPIRRGFSGYNRQSLFSDASAGFNVALLAFPQGMAYAVIAELPIQYGIVSGAIAAVVAPLFAGSRHTILGPTNATAFMLFASMAAFSASDRLFYLPLLVLFIGILLTIGALFRVAELVQYVSRSVVVGYISAAAILIIANQLRHMMGVELPETTSSGPKTFFTILQGTLLEVKHLQWQPVVLSLSTFALWGALTLKFKKLPVFAIVLVVMTATYDLLHHYSSWTVATFDPFSISDLKPRLPSISDKGFFTDVSRLIGLAFSIAFLAALENSVMSKTLASRAGDRPDVNQDMLSVGMANLAASLTGGMPASGSLTRSALNFASGAVSRLSSIISGLLCTAGLLLLGEHMNLVPKCVLAALVVCIAASVINRHHIRISLYATPSDAAVLITTFIAALLMPLNVAIFLGVGISIMLYLRAASRPYLAEYEFSEQGELREAGEKRGRPMPAISIVHVEGDLFFGAAELFRTQIQKTSLDPALKVIILRLKNARHLDATSVVALEEMVQFLRSHERHVIISGATKEVYRVLKNAGSVDVINKKNIFLNNPKNPNLSTRHALKRAQELLGTTEADIRIFYDPSKDRK